ncbi:MAG: DUF2726 domain-containing protein [Anaerolineae bacterium]|nr:MAG: DUF2726 domain-containing protein [Anaerolineae bacterium]
MGRQGDSPESVGADSGAHQKALPYRLRGKFLSAGEEALCRLLQRIAGERFLICPKVALTELVTVARPNENVHFYNKIFRKSVDFLLLSRRTMKPVMGVQLVTPGEKGPRPGERFLQEVFSAIGLPLVSIPIAERYSLEEILPLFRLALVKVQSSPPRDKDADFAPLCPKCGITMVLRVVREGPRAGTKYYGCMNYPRCKETLPLPS